MFNDTSFNGLSDIIKRNESGMDKLLGPLDSASPFEFAGVKFQQTTTAPTATIGGNTYYNTYIYGDDAISNLGILDGQLSLNNKANSVNISSRKHRAKLAA